MKQDDVQRIMAVIERVAPIGEARAMAEQQLRAELGGQRLRIEARPPLDMGFVDQRLRQRVPVREIARELGVHRATLYKHLQPKSRRAR